MGGVLFAERRDAHRVAVGDRHALAPSRELGARPLEAMILVPEAASRQRRKHHVVVGVLRGDDDGAGLRIAEHRALHVAESVGLDVLDDLDKRRRVVAPQTGVAVDECTL